MWLAMTRVYWAAQQIPSGLIAVEFGLAPLVTGWMAAVWFGGSRVVTIPVAAKTLENSRDA